MIEKQQPEVLASATPRIGFRTLATNLVYGPRNVASVAAGLLLFDHSGSLELFLQVRLSDPQPPPILAIEVLKPLDHRLDRGNRWHAINRFQSQAEPLFVAYCSSRVRRLVQSQHHLIWVPPLAANGDLDRPETSILNEAHGASGFTSRIGQLDEAVPEMDLVGLLRDDREAVCLQAGRQLLERRRKIVNHDRTVTASFCFGLQAALRRRRELFRSPGAELQDRLG